MTLEELKSKLPKGSMISNICFEGSDITVYTKNKNFFLEGSNDVRALVQQYRKRIEIRSDPAICEEQEKTKKSIKRLVSDEAEIQDIIFEPEFSKVIIYAKKPGLVIGKYGSILNKIKEETGWSPETRRVPLIQSDIVNKAREIVHTNSKYRQTFLNRIGEKIQFKKGSKDGWVRLSFLGSGREVGRSCILLQTKESRVLFDCGVNVGSDLHRNPHLEAPEFDLEALDAVVISHAHLDHAGFLPYLYEYGYEGPVYLTTPTRDVMILQQIDYIKTMQAETGSCPYTSNGVKNAIKHSITLDYGAVCDITPDMRLTFHNAGHILGSAMCHVHIGEGLHNLVYGADFNYARSALFDPADNNFQRVETFIMESTYGGPTDVNPPRDQAQKFLFDTIDQTLKRGGKVIIPSFAVGRAQEVMVMLAERAEREGWNYPVHLDGMIWDTTAIHTTYPEFLSNYLQKQIFHKGNNPFASPIFHRVGTAVDRDKVINEEPSVILTTSGMMTGGPVLEYMRYLSEDEKNTLIFVGYQAEGTLGRNIQMGWKDISLNKTAEDSRGTLRLKLQVETAKGFSAHSDKNQLLNFVQRLQPKLERVILNHGELAKVINISRTIHKMFKIETAVPRNLDVLRIK